MSRIDQLITEAQAEVTAAKALPDTDETKAAKVAAAEAKLTALQASKKAAEDEINDAVRNRIPGAETSAKEAERKRIAQILGIPTDQVSDEKLQEVKEAYQGRLSETEREKQARETAEQRATTLETEAQRNKRIAETARAQLEDTLKRQAVERALLAEDVIHGTGKDEQGNERKSYLAAAAEQALRLGQVSAQVEVDNDGNLQVKGEVQGAADAAKKAKEEFPVFFGDTSGVVNPPSTPQGGGGGGKGGSKSAYRPPLSVTGPSQQGGGQ